MSIIIRKTGNREYAYVAHRDGARMVQSYIGPLARPEVRRRVEAAEAGDDDASRIRRGCSRMRIPVPSTSRGTLLRSSRVCWSEATWRTCEWLALCLSHQCHRRRRAVRRRVVAQDSQLLARVV